MRRLIIILGLVVFLAANFGQTTVQADSPVTSEKEIFTGEVLCLPGVYLEKPDNCLPVGPSKVLTQLAKDGIIFPPPPLPVSKPSVSLNVIPFQYAKINSPSAPLYSSLAEADAKVARFNLAGDTRYISYSYGQQTDVGYYYMAKTGMWVDGGDVARATPRFSRELWCMQHPRHSLAGY
jgi:hypothetical protein